MNTTNENFAKHDKVFKTACELADVQPTRRQASRWRNARGRAYAKRTEAIAIIISDNGVQPTNEDR